MSVDEARTGDTSPGPARLWFLEGYVDQTRSLRRFPLNEFPYRMGRQEDLELCLPSAEISRVHAEIVSEGGELAIRDLGSTNGTFVNHEPVGGATKLQEGDIIHVATLEMRLVAIDPDHAPSSDTTRHGVGPLSANLPTGSRELQEMLAKEQVSPAFQPILTPGGEFHGWEMLGRGAHPDLTYKPMELFRIAESLGLEIVLSDLFRQVGLKVAAERHPSGLYFFNTHPRETDRPEEFLRNMEQMRTDHPDLRLVVELHEGAFADVGVLGHLRTSLQSMDIGLAFDDFGAGQARLVELADAPPDYVKLDISLIRDIDRAPKARRDMVEMVLEYSRKLDILCVAEGVSRKGEADTCREMGFDLLQGFHLGYPESADSLPG
jgi:EAL domain-containing protein (putative c-di-GMP-specific phosphodiesterase class I)